MAGFTQIDFMGGKSQGELPKGTPLVYSTDVLDAVRAATASADNTAPPVFNFYSSSNAPAAQSKKPVNWLVIVLIVAAVIAVIVLIKKYVK